ncbi:MAG: DUF547 domain-containing protein [Candidatus Sifarchaeia archaeon]
MIEEVDEVQNGLAGVLRQHLDQSGNVDYFALLAENSVVQYAKSLEDFNLKVLKTREERLAFWINVYNALSIYGVVKKLKQDPGFARRGNKSLVQKARFFVMERFSVGGRRFSLWSLENYIRTEFKEPRIHFALNCSSLSCPPLRNGLYSAVNLESELEQATRLYINGPHGSRLDRDNNVLWLSMIFKWYRKDFESVGVTVLDFVTRYLPENDKQYAIENSDSLTIKHMDYDWSLNVQ